MPSAADWITLAEAASNSALRVLGNESYSRSRGREGGRMGLGYCLLQRCGTPAPSPDRVRIFKGGILNRSPVYESLWTG